MEKMFFYKNKTLYSNYYKNDKEEYKNCGPSELALSLRKQRINEKIGLSRVHKQKSQFEIEYGNKEITLLNNLSQNLNNQKDIKATIEILDQLYIFFINFKDPIKKSYIELSKIIPHLYSKMVLFKDKEIVIIKSFDVFEQIIRLVLSYEKEDKYCLIFNEQYCQLIFSLILLSK